MIEKLPWNSHDDDKMKEFLVSVTQVVTQLRVDDITIIPAGWLSPKSRHVVLCVLARKQGCFCLTVCNTGEGLEYHASGVDPNTSHDTKGMMMVIDDIPEHKLGDSAFWFFTTRMLAYMHPKNKAKWFYQRLLPFLNEKPLKVGRTEMKYEESRTGLEFARRGRLAFACSLARGGEHGPEPGWLDPRGGASQWAHQLNHCPTHSRTLVAAPRCLLLASCVFLSLAQGEHPNLRLPHAHSAWPRPAAIAMRAAGCVTRLCGERPDAG
jgi:hypothetical protein